MVWTPRLSSALDGIPAYRAGLPPRVTPGLVSYKMSSNENPYPPLPGVLEAVAAAAAEINRYPSPQGAALAAALAARLGVPTDEVSVAPGSFAVLTDLVRATCGQGDEIVYAWRSFEAYPIIVQLAGAVGVPVPLTPTCEHDLDAMADAVTDRTRLVLVCTPNNPTGPVVGAEAFERFADRVPADVVIAVDEAYGEFVREPGALDGVRAGRARPNVVSLRTFSKAYGLAGLRVGYGIGHPTIMQALRATAAPFGVSIVAQAAALASLEAEPELLRRVETLVVERDRVAAALRAGGWTVPAAQGNFVWLPLGERTLDFAEAAELRGLSVRPFADEGVRVTIDAPAANDLLLDLCSTYQPATVL